MTETTELVPNIILSLVYSGLGLVIFILAFALVDRLTPGSLWKEIIDDQNVALGVMMAGVAIAISIVIAASIF
jgi:putative membrane protein